MNYAALTLDELCRFATTDKGARQYLADNAAEIIESVEDIERETVQGVIDDAYQSGKDEGWSECRKDLRERFEEELGWGLDRLEKQGPLKGNGKRLHDLLQAISMTIL